MKATLFLPRPVLRPSISLSGSSALQLLAFLHSRLEVDTGFLVGLDEFREPVYPQIILKSSPAFPHHPFIANMDFVGIHIFHHTVPFQSESDPHIAGCLSFQSRSNYRNIRIISGTACRCMLDPISARLAPSCSRKGIRDALRPTIWFGSHVHEFFFLIENREVTRLTADDPVVYRFVQRRSGASGFDFREVFFRAEVRRFFMSTFALSTFPVGRFDKAHVLILACT